MNLINSLCLAAIAILPLNSFAQLAVWQQYHDVTANLSYVASAVGSDGSFYTATRYNNAYTFNGSQVDLLDSSSSSETLIIKYNNAGEIMWQKRLAITEGSNPTPGAIEFMAVDASGYIYLSTQGFGGSGFIRVENDSIPFTGTGNRIIQLNPSGNIRSSKQLNSANIYNISCGGEFVYVAGYSGSNSVIQKYDSTFTTPLFSLSGNMNVFLGASAFQRTQMACSPSGEFTVLLAVEGGGAGTFNGDTLPRGTASGFDELYVILCDSAGNYIRTSTFLADDSLPASVANPHAVAVDNEGKIYISSYITASRIFAGDTIQAPNANSNARTVIACWDANGAESWISQVYRSNSSGSCFVQGLGISQEGNLLFTGNTGGTLSFNENEISTSPQTRSFSGKIDAETGELIWLLEPQVVQNTVNSHRISAIDEHRFIVSGSANQSFQFACIDAVEPEQSNVQYAIIIDENAGLPLNADFSFEYLPDSVGHIQFTSLGEGADSWFWDFGDGNTSSEENPDHYFSQDITYPVSLIVDNCLYSDTISINVSVVFPGFENANNNGIHLYPNPVYDVVQVEGINDFKLFDVSGKEIQFEKTKFNTVNVSGLKPGMYFLQSAESSAKFIKCE